MKKDYVVYLEDMIKAIDEIETSTKTISFESIAVNFEKGH